MIVKIKFVRKASLFLPGPPPPAPRAASLQNFYILGDKILSVNFKFWTANPQTAPFQTIACKNNETFHIFGHFKVRRPPPCPLDQCWKKWVEFSLFSHPHNIELGVRGGIYAVVSIIFAPDCR
jgi:hypothetical protein